MNKILAIEKGPPAAQSREWAFKLRAIRAGSQIIDQIFWELLKLIKSGRKLTEQDLAYTIKRRGLQMGASGMAFGPIVAFGRGSAEIHHWAANKKIGRDNFLMLDYGVRVGGYCSDFTRTLFIGNPKKIHKQIYNIVLQSQLATIKKIVPGVTSDVVDFTARHLINQSGFGKYFTHGTGHGVGRKIHERPSFKTNTNDLLMKNTVVTVEPGIYLPGKFGVRIEDMILVSPKPKVFSDIPKRFQDMII